MTLTAVEWFFKHLEGIRIIDGYEWIKLQQAFEQAKAMEKAEKDKQYQRGFKDGSNHIKIIYNL